jgi:hypothetical protein
MATNPCGQKVFIIHNLNNLTIRLSASFVLMSIKMQQFLLPLMNSKPTDNYPCVMKLQLVKRLNNRVEQAHRFRPCD